jgi:hypothetical protein
MTAVSNPFVPHLVPLAPRGWRPDPHITGGDRPWQTLHIPEDHWIALGMPQNIEEYYEKLRTLETGPAVNTVNFRGFKQSPEM